MRENEKEREELEASHPKTFLMEKNLVTVLIWGFYSQTPFTNYQKLQIQKLLQGESRKKTKK